MATDDMRAALVDAAAEARRAADYTRRDLIDRMRYLSRDLATEAGRSEVDRAHALNSLGVVQTRGAEIDRLCAVLREQDDHADLLDKLVQKGGAS